MIARLRVVGQETWHYNVVRATCENGYLTLDLDAYPHRVHHWIGWGAYADVYANREDVTAALCVEQAQSKAPIKRSGWCWAEYDDYLAGIHDPRD